MLLARPAAAQGAAVSAIVPVTEAPVRAYSKFEAAASLTKQFANPYDPDSIAVEVDFISPSQKRYKAYAFYLVPYARDTLGWHRVPTTTPWHVRFSPNEAGRWQYAFTVTDKTDAAHVTSTVSSPATFTCVPSPAHGFLRVAANKRYWEFSDGTSFMGISEDVRSAFDPAKIASCTPDPSQLCPGGKPCYTLLTRPQQQAWIGKFHANGGNLVRLWLEPYSYEFEWDTLGNYGARQNRAGDLDSLIEYAGAHQVYVHLVLYGSRNLSTNAGTADEGSGWALNPYRRRFGLASLLDFYTQPAAIRAFKNRLRYIQARWGYSAAIASYGLMNEPEMPDDATAANTIYYPNVAKINAWFEDMAAFLKTDAYPAHLVSVDYGYGFSSATFSSPNVDFSSAHYYTWDKNAQYQFGYIAQHHLRKYDKPFAQLEFGPQTWLSQGNQDIQQGIWSSAFSGAFATAFLFGPDGRYNNGCWGGDGIRLFKPLSVFMAGEEFNSLTFTYQPIGTALSAYAAASRASGGRPLGYAKPAAAPAFDAAGFAPTADYFAAPFDSLNLARDIVASDPRLEVFALRAPEKILGWVHDQAYYWYNTPHRAAGNPALFPLNPTGPDIRNPAVPLDTSMPAVSPLANQTITISGLAHNGVYTVEWYSTAYAYDSNGTGKLDGGRITNPRLGGSSRATANGGILLVAVPKLQPTELGEPPFAPDYGFKITLESEADHDDTVSTSH
ncbi:DUF5060 domain-containing protein [Hymenobacter sp. BRD128]|uniref:DUF5060 domain-containing protein n=1 Tax=Hymenobacter sp. BRD128 TaxID=2675878 RepID=UPI001563AFB2|nr:DUF5060 domain-containing protein [Hymenobacter sp. BRD128]QKG57175.1 DUF5060 domain-containing protein [Hymenobacter sp. BRD128]